MRKQQGIALFFSLIVLIVMTVIGIALAVNSGQSLRMSGAGSERIEAVAKANGALALVIANYSGAPFANLETETPTTELGGDQLIKPLPDAGGKDVSCQRTSRAMGANLISCRRFEIVSSVSFGREKLGALTVASGVEQQVLTGN